MEVVRDIHWRQVEFIVITGGRTNAGGDDAEGRRVARLGQPAGGRD